MQACQMASTLEVYQDYVCHKTGQLGLALHQRTDLLSPNTGVKQPHFVDGSPGAALQTQTPRAQVRLLIFISIVSATDILEDCPDH